jgi:hypothetical protein
MPKLFFLERLLLIIYKDTNKYVMSSFFYLIFNLFIKHLIISILWYFFFNYLVNNYKISCFSLITCTIFITHCSSKYIYSFLGINKILIFLLPLSIYYLVLIPYILLLTYINILTIFTL